MGELVSRWQRRVDVMFSVSLSGVMIELRYLHLKLEVKKRQNLGNHHRRFQMLYYSFLILFSQVCSDRITVEENVEVKQNCGARYLDRRRYLRSTDGINAIPYEYPWIAAVEVFKEYDNERTGCTAVQISSRHLLTATHCVIQKSRIWKQMCNSEEKKSKFVFYWDISLQYIRIYIGSACLHPKLCRGRKVYQPAEVFYPEDYDPCTRENDLAVIELGEDIPVTEATPICMPDQYDTLERTLTAVGFGLDPSTPEASEHLFGYLRAVDLSLVPGAQKRTLIRTKTHKRAIVEDH